MKPIKKQAYILILLLCASVSLYAQKKLSREEFRARQEAFLTEKANLTSQEAKQFFPLYFELQDKKSQCNKEAWRKIRKGKEANLSDKEYNDIVEAVIQSRITADQLDMEYVRKFKKILPAKKIYDIQRAEMRFHRELLKPQKKK